MNKKRQVLKYLFSDFITAAAAWSLIYIYRKVKIEPEKFGYEVPVEFDNQFYLGLILVPIFWIIIYTLSGTYKNIYRRSRLSELSGTFFSTIIGVIILFFVLLLDDEVLTYTHYYKIFGTLFLIHFFLTAAGRLILSTITVKKVHNRKIQFNTILIGSNDKALNLYKELESQTFSSGQHFVGFVHVENDIHLLKPHLPHLGGPGDLKELIEKYQVEDAIIAIESSEHESLGKILNILDNTAVTVKVIPDMYDIMSGSVKMTSIFGAPLIAINREIMPVWQQYTKRAIDISTSLILLTLFSPVFLVLAIGVKLSSRGPIFYNQERVGRYGKPFLIHKFRSMAVDAEKNGPALSSSEDNRVTKFGRFLRKHRLDELPNFLNVLKGEMSIVGPRPERQHYIDQIVEIAPHYTHLHKVRPGITSWGQVKYGYAENVEQMTERLKFDILYIENMSILVDLKIIIYTINTVLKGQGK